jgi:PAS domain-containing protein
LEYRIVRRNGTCTIRGTGLLRYDAAGQPCRITGTLQDITDRRRDEEGCAP